VRGPCSPQVGVGPVGRDQCYVTKGHS
jgi:hypothetical protein